MRRFGTSLAAGEDSGFSLIELLLVVAIIAIIVSVAIPSLMNSRMAANETTAISYLRTWVSAQEIYHLKYGAYADADDQLFDEGLIGSKPAADSHGYTFTVDNPPGSQHTWWGAGGPDIPGQTGTRYFFVDQSGVIRYSTSSTATASSTPLGDS